MSSRRTFLRVTGGGAVSLVGVGSAAGVQGAKETVRSEDLKKKTILIFLSFYKATPDRKRERFAGVWELSEAIIESSNKLLTQIPQISQVSDLNDFGEPITGVLRNVIQNVSEAYDIQISTKYLDKAVRFTGYLPLIAQIWNVLQASLDVQNVADTKARFIKKAHSGSDKDSVDRFYIALLLLLAEIVFLWSGVGYRAAFGTTRRVANVGLVRLRGQLGLRAYSILLSIVHWLVRGTFETTASYIIEKTDEVARSFSNTEYRHFSKLSKEQISEALPGEKSSVLSDILSSDLLFGSQAESKANAIIDSGTEKYLMENYGGFGIIQIKDSNESGSDSFFG